MPLLRFAPRFRLALPLLALAACTPQVTSQGGGLQVTKPANVAVVAGPAPIDTSAGTVTVRDAQNSDGVLKVALLVPLSGANAAIGEAMKNAAQMAVFEAGTTGFQLLSRDSGNTPQTAQAAATQVVTEGADLIIGPLLSAQARPVSQVVATSGVPVVTLSNDRTLVSDGLLVMGLIPADQLRRVLSYAAAHGKQTISIIAPAGPYGDSVIAAANEIMPQTGQTLSAVARGTTGPDLTQFQANGGLDADSILVALDPKQMAQTAMTLSTMGLVPAPGKILGTGQLDGANVGAANPAMAGIWFASTPGTQRAAYEQRYRDSYKATPARISTIAYDATLLAAALGRQPMPAGQSPFTRSALMAPAGFAGVDGIFRFRPNGESERGLAVYQIGVAGPAVIDPAPTSFNTAPGM